MIEVQAVTKSYGSIQALKDVSFRVADGEIVGLLGPNGAGKTTMIKILTGYLQQDEGSVTVDGLDILTATQAVQARIGYLPENAPAYPELTVQSYLKMMADLRQIPSNEQRERLSEAIYAVGLQERLTQPIGTLSKGFRQRVGLAQAILNRPRLLILDEPSVGLDPTQIVEMRNLIRRLAQFSTILFSTHILPEVEALCSRVIILLNGQVKANALLSELSGGNDAVLILGRKVDDAHSRLKKLPGVIGVEMLPATNNYISYRVSAEPNADICPAIFQVAQEQQWPLRELHSDHETLESVFSQLAA